jgi:HJR/Mrr/RecB family endonuclease
MPAPAEWHPVVFYAKAAFWALLSGAELEAELAAVLRALGHVVVETGGPGDEGVDLLVDGHTVVQCKRHAQPTSIAVAEALLESKQQCRAARARLVSTSGVTGEAARFCHAHGIEVWDLSALVRLRERA